MNTREMLSRAKAAVSVPAGLSAEEKNRALLSMADALENAEEHILAENEKDLRDASQTMNTVMLDRLSLTPERIRAMADGIREVAALPDPVGETIEETTRPNGLFIQKKRVPIGVVAIIYESRPNVTSDAAALCFKSGNVCVLRGGKEAFRSSKAIQTALQTGLANVGLPIECVSMPDDPSRESATELMNAVGLVDLLIPRGGAGLIRACTENAKVPCIQTGTGICHIFADASADTEKALRIIENAKTSRPSVCNAAEVLLVHERIAPTFLPALQKRLTEDRLAKGLIPVELRLDERALRFCNGTPATKADFDTEFLDYILAVKVVKDVETAIAHIAAHSTHHSEAILTEDEKSAELFVRNVDSAAVYVNASTRFTDGGEFGFGCEIGISTQKLHARGPMGLKELTTCKYVIRGDGQIR